MAEGIARANGIDLWYETFGSKNDPPILLIMGTGAQGLFWDTDFCTRLAAAGRFVIRFDNRDVGRSTWFDDRPAMKVEDLQPATVAVFRERGLPPNLLPVYLLGDMARDAVGLLDALELRSAHVVGLSSGAFIAQFIAIEHGERVRTLTSVGGSPFGPTDTEAEPQHPEAQQLGVLLLFEQPPESREQRIAFWMRCLTDTASAMSPAEERTVSSLVATAVDRAWNLEGMRRIAAAALFSPSRVSKLGALRIPTLVIHGSDDPAVPVSHGIATAKLVPDAELLVIEGMAHDLPLQSTWTTAFDAIVRHSARTSH